MWIYVYSHPLCGICLFNSSVSPFATKLKARLQTLLVFHCKRWMRYKQTESHMLQQRLSKNNIVLFLVESSKTKKKRFRRCHESNLSCDLSFNWAAIAWGQVTSLGQSINPNWMWSEIAMIWVDGLPSGAEVHWQFCFRSWRSSAKESRPLNNVSPSIRLNNVSLLCTLCAGKFGVVFDIWWMTWFWRKEREKLFLEVFHSKMKKNKKWVR